MTTQQILLMAAAGLCIAPAAFRAGWSLAHRSHRWWSDRKASRAWRDFVDTLSDFYGSSGRWQ